MAKRSLENGTFTITVSPEECRNLDFDRYGGFHLDIDGNREGIQVTAGGIPEVRIVFEGNLFNPQENGVIRLPVNCEFTSPDASVSASHVIVAPQSLVRSADEGNVTIEGKNVEVGRNSMISADLHLNTSGGSLTVEHGCRIDGEISAHDAKNVDIGNDNLLVNSKQDSPCFSSNGAENVEFGNRVHVAGEVYAVNSEQFTAGNDFKVDTMNVSGSDNVEIGDRMTVEGQDESLTSVDASECSSVTIGEGANVEGFIDCTDTDQYDIAGAEQEVTSDDQDAISSFSWEDLEQSIENEGDMDSQLEADSLNAINQEESADLDTSASQDDVSAADIDSDMDDMDTDSMKDDLEDTLDDLDGGIE